MLQLMLNAETNDSDIYNVNMWEMKEEEEDGGAGDVSPSDSAAKNRYVVGKNKRMLTETVRII